MRLKKVHLEDFKRFTDLTIDLGDNPSKIIALVGPNGCGKSSILDAFEEKKKEIKRMVSDEQMSFFLKDMSADSSSGYNRNKSIKLSPQDDRPFNEKSLYMRSSYRFTPKIHLDSITARPSMLEDNNRPTSSIQLDNRMRENYAMLQSLLLSEYEQGTKTGIEFKREYLDRINGIIQNILDVRIFSLGNIGNGRGQLYFEKGITKDFPYENLSAGEKEVIDIVIDLVLKKEEFNDTVFFIDEPELHLNTSIQRKLLVEINKLIPENCQLWVATHSIGFLRALQDEVKDDSSVIDFSGKDFDKEQFLKPIDKTREDWQRIFEVALEDITGLMAPKRIVYCEGGLQLSLDEKMFNLIFGKEFSDTMFISSSNKDSVIKYSQIALTVLNKAFNGVEIIALVDRDDDTQEQTKKSNVKIKRLKRREFENYLYDEEILKIYCEKNNRAFDENRYKKIVPDIKDTKVKTLGMEIMNDCCNTDKKMNKNALPKFNVELAQCITKDTNVYKQLKKDILVDSKGMM